MAPVLGLGQQRARVRDADEGRLPDLRPLAGRWQQVLDQGAEDEPAPAERDRVDLQRPDFFDRYRRIVAESGTAPEDIKLEITEGVLMKDPEQAASTLKACRALVSEGMRVNVTLCFSVSQALLAAKAGASYISPFVGRIDDISGEGMQLIHQIRQVYDNYGFTTEILAASIRHPVHVVESMMMGADCCTLPPSVLWQLTKHPLTDRGLESFLKDWETLGARI